MNFNDFSAQDGSENDPKLAQNHSKTVPKAIIFHVEFLLQFWSVLGSVLAPFWDPFGLQDRSKIGPKIDQKPILFFDRFLMPFWLHFGSDLGAFLDPFWYQNRPKFRPSCLFKLYLLQKHDVHETL